MVSAEETEVRASVATAVGGVVVEAHDLERQYGEGETAVHALRGVSLAVERGQLVAVMGPSGSGKSTLMHILAGLDKPTSGTVTIAGTEITGLDDAHMTHLRRDHIGFVFQFFNLLPMLTAEENVLLPLSIAGEKPDKQWLDELLSKTGLSDRRHHRPSELSGGQQQRVAIARALVTKPTILFADEPTGNLDSKTGGEILNLLRDSARDYNQTIVMVTHEARAAVDRRSHPVHRRRADRQGTHRHGCGSGARSDEHASVVTRVALRGLLGRKLRAALTAFAIVIGVAMVSGTFVLTDTIKAAFTTVFTTVYQNTDAVITGKSAISSSNNGNAPTTPSLPASLLTQVRALPSVGIASGGISDTAQLVGRNGKVISSGGAPGLAFSYSTAGEHFNPLQLTSGRLPDQPERDRHRRLDREQARLQGRRRDRRRRAGARGAVPDRGHRQDRRRLLARGRHDLGVHAGQGAGAVQQGRQIRLDQRRRQARVLAPAARESDQAAARAERAGQDRSAAGPAGDQRHQRVPQHLPGLPARVRRHRPVRRKLRDRQHAVDHDRPAHPGAGHAPHAGGDAPPGAPLGARRGVRDRHARVDRRAVPRPAAGQGAQLAAGVVRDRPAPGGDRVQDADDRDLAARRDHHHDDRGAPAGAARDAGARRSPRSARARYCRRRGGPSTARTRPVGPSSARSR